MYFSVQSKPHI